MTRKEFIGTVVAMLGILLFKHMPFTSGKNTSMQAPNSYGNGSYGGSTKK